LKSTEPRFSLMRLDLGWLILLIPNFS
jgi:hypothetical protein